MSVLRSTVLVLLVCTLFLTSVWGATCIEDPTQMSCMNYMYDGAQADVDSLCSMMSNMIACTINTDCKKGKASGQYCDSFSLLSDICVADSMSGMGGCANYNSLCAADSMVTECTSHSAIPDMITTDDAINDILDMCNEMYMTPCDQCTSASSKDCPDPLSTLVLSCNMMPDMSQCSGLFDMCKAMSDPGMDIFCGGKTDKHTVPAMKMYFHTGINDYFLFQSFVPQSDTAYGFACFALFALGVLLTFIRSLRQSQENAWMESDKRKSSHSDNKFLSEVEVEDGHVQEYTQLDGHHNGGVPWSRNLQRCIFTIVILILDYSLMLLVMTFNVGVCLSVIGGLGFGQLVLGHKLHYEGTETCCSS